VAKKATGQPIGYYDLTAGCFDTGVRFRLFVWSKDDPQPTFNQVDRDDPSKGGMGTSTVVSAGGKKVAVWSSAWRMEQKDIESRSIFAFGEERMADADGLGALFGAYQSQLLMSSPAGSLKDLLTAETITITSTLSDGTQSTFSFDAKSDEFLDFLRTCQNIAWQPKTFLQEESLAAYFQRLAGLIKPSLTPKDQKKLQDAINEYLQGVQTHSELLVNDGRRDLSFVGSDRLDACFQNPASKEACVTKDLLDRVRERMDRDDPFRPR
jgi:hypothetical protein